MNNICIVRSDRGSCTTIIWAKSYDQRYLLLCLAFDLMFVCDQRTIYAWGHQDNFTSNMGHPRSYSVEMLVEDVMRQHLGPNIVLWAPRGSTNSIDKELTTRIDHM
jgi:hypothetical protein